MKAKKELFVINAGAQALPFSSYAYDFAEFYTHCYGAVVINFRSVEEAIMGGGTYEELESMGCDNYGVWPEHES